MIQSGKLIKPGFFERHPFMQVLGNEDFQFGGENPKFLFMYPPKKYCHCSYWLKNATGTIVLENLRHPAKYRPSVVQ